tara:strand:- start:30 stop:245 length:216 start_codon:yes stop_codon:yes gene_type:complete
MDSIKKKKMWECIKSVPYLDTLDENVTEQFIILKVRGTFLENVEPVLIILFSLLLIILIFGFILRKLKIIN